MVKAPAEQEKATWAGALVPAVELDDSEAGDMIVVVVKLIDDRQAAASLPCRLHHSDCPESLAEVAHHPGICLPTSTLLHFSAQAVARD